MSAPIETPPPSDEPLVPMETLRVNVERALTSVFDARGVVITADVVDQVLAEVRDSLWLAQTVQAAERQPCSNCEATTFACTACGARLEEY